MYQLVELLLAATDLLQANIERTRAGAYDIMLGSALIRVFAWLVFAGSALLIASVCLLLLRVMPIEGALLISAVLALALSGGMLWLGKNKTRG